MEGCRRYNCVTPDMDRANILRLQNHRQIGAVEDGARSARRDYVLLRRSPRMAPILRPVSLAHRTETAYPRLPTIEQSNSQWPRLQSPHLCRSNTPNATAPAMR